MNYEQSKSVHFIAGTALHIQSGVDGGVLPYEDFVAVLGTDEFRKMDIFPMANSVGRIDGLIVVKFEEEFPLYG